MVAGERWGTQPQQEAVRRVVSAKGAPLQDPHTRTRRVSGMSTAVRNPPGSASRPAEGPRPSLRVRRRRAVALFVVATVVVLGLVAFGLSISSGSGLPPLPSTAFRARIVTIAESQLGYRTDPSSTYCNKFSAFWGAGKACKDGLRKEEWCADFAAWVWRKAGAQFTYSYASTDINAASGSFYLWAVDHGTWHPAGSGYTPQPGDVAVYGLDPTTGSAAHVAVVTGDAPGARGPDVVNGDGDRTGFSVVETGTDQYKADTPGTPSPLSGYASPMPPVPSTT
jgi:hypothetical protein